MQMRSFAMLLPCGISLFSGVEFVCCPKHFKGEILSLLLRGTSPASEKHSLASLWREFIMGMKRGALWERNFITQFISLSHIDIFPSISLASEIYFDNIFHLFS
jgi:hypothetical protein